MPPFVPGGINGATWSATGVHSFPFGEFLFANLTTEHDLRRFEGTLIYLDSVGTPQQIPFLFVPEPALGGIELRRYLLVTWDRWATLAHNIHCMP